MGSKKKKKSNDGRKSSPNAVSKNKIKKLSNGAKMRKSTGNIGKKKKKIKKIKVKKTNDESTVDSPTNISPSFAKKRSSENIKKKKKAKAKLKMKNVKSSDAAKEKKSKTKSKKKKKEVTKNSNN